jgi:GntR family negative regulator for fad regulon and positive regulator of fabA
VVRPVGRPTTLPSPSAAARKPAARAEEALLAAILDGRFPAGSALPGERELAAELSVTRPTLREALQRLERDGWLRIRQGRPTSVADFLSEGGLNVLATLARRAALPPGRTRPSHGGPVLDDLVEHLLEVRLALAPAYARLAVERDPGAVTRVLEPSASLPEEATAYAAFDWALHRALARASRNPAFTLILNGFAELYRVMAAGYFESGKARDASKAFYSALARAARRKDAPAARRVVRDAMRESRELWRESRTPRPRAPRPSAPSAPGHSGPTSRGRAQGRTRA